MVKFPTRRSLLTAGTGGSLAAVAAAFLLRGRPGEPVPEPSSTQPAASASGTGSLRTDLTAHSRLLGRNVPYSLYLPAAVSSVLRRGGQDGGLPVVFLLHGVSGKHTDWVSKGGIVATLERAIAAGRIPACALVMPDARRDPGEPGGGQDETFYINDAGSGPGVLRYEDMFIEEFVPTVEKAHGLGGRAENRSVAGLSIGGYGALWYALRYPGLFSAAAGLSTAHFTDEGYRAMPMKEWNRFFGHAFGRDRAGSARLTDRFMNYNLAAVIRRTAPARLRHTRWYLGCGTEDTNFLPGTGDLRTAFAARGVTPEAVLQPGVHGWSYWSVAAEPMLDFLGRQFS
ncbi:MULTISPECIES: alpha/beta hydrolase [unclassified Streptomyces]|uniref:alpha/beta hydrolase n=1 Tax=unclassified Streptomyces TaxID=2593676 RepID=UPI002E33BD18|nr:MULTISPECIES: alpha/beta hydrolase-fold protein [unclassified Streptomyces]WUC68289.1 alpha/beta hydrolase-fold protein [Streptomyces sp. NBC_00539]